MILQIITIVLILGYGYYMWRRGLFEAVIMAVCCLFAAGFAVTCYQFVASTSGLDKSQPTFGEPLTMGLLFLVSLFIMRVLADKFIKYDLSLPLYVDKSIAAVLGVISAMIMVGIPLVMIQMVPLGDRSVMGYAAFDDNLKNYSKISPFAPDDFVLGIGRVFSTASMGNENPMPTAQEQKLEWFIRRNSADLGGDTLARQENLVRVKQIYKLKSIQVDPISRMPDTIRPGVDYGSYAIRCVVDINASDEDKWWRLPATQFALYARDKKGNTNRYFPIGYVIRQSTQTTPGWTFKMIPDAQEAAKQAICTLAVQRAEKNASMDDKGLIVDWVYQIPDNEKMVNLVFRNDKPVILKTSAIQQGMPMDPKKYRDIEATLSDRNDKGLRLVFPKKSPEEKFDEKAQKLPSPIIKQTTKDKLKAINAHEQELEKTVQKESAPTPPKAAPKPAAPAPAAPAKPATAPAASKPGDKGFVFNPKRMYIKCMETGEIFEIDPQKTGPEMMMAAGPGQKIKNPKTGKMTCVMMMRCPACNKFFVPKNATDPNAMMGGGPIICTECNTDINKWYREHRKRRR